MVSLLQQLENNEVVLLMYLADELPAEDRAEVEQMLAVDANMRGELRKIAAAQGEVMLNLDRLDAASAPLISESVAVRQVSRVMKQWQVDRLVRQPVPIERAGLRYPWWMYPTAAVVAILLAIIVGWGMKPDTGMSVYPSSTEMAYRDAGGEATLRLEDSYKATELTDVALGDAERQAMALARPVDDTSSIFLVDSEN